MSTSDSGLKFSLQKPADMDLVHFRLTSAQCTICLLQPCICVTRCSESTLGKCFWADKVRLRRAFLKSLRGRGKAGTCARLSTARSDQRFKDSVSARWWRLEMKNQSKPISLTMDVKQIRKFVTGGVKQVHERMKYRPKSLCDQKVNLLSLNKSLRSR